MSASSIEAEAADAPPAVPDHFGFRGPEEVFVRLLTDPHLIGKGPTADLTHLFATDDSEGVVATDQTNVVHAGGGDDFIYGSLDNLALIDGGDGNDVYVIYEGKATDYSVTEVSDGVYQLCGPGIDGRTINVLLTNVETIYFNGGTGDGYGLYSPADLASGQTGTPAT
ncbi:MAG: hypothetical protein R3C49_00275 [Planctomycetaceae bacterium]